MLGKFEGKRRSGQQRMRWLDSMTDSMDMNLSKLRTILEDRGGWHATVHGVAKSWIQLSDRTTTPAIYICVRVCVCVCVCVRMPVLVAQSCLFAIPMGCSSPGSSIHRILQARILE